MRDRIMAQRVTMWDAKKHFANGGKVIVSEQGHLKEIPFGPSTNYHTRETTDWDYLVSVVRMWATRYPNQRYYIVPARHTITFKEN